MKWQTALALGLALALPSVGMRASDMTDRYGIGSEPGSVSSTPNGDRYGDGEMAPDATGDVDRSDALGDRNGDAVVADTNAAIENNETDNNVDQEMNGTDNEGSQAEAAPNANSESSAQVQVTERQPMFADTEIHSPLQGFVSHQAHEVGELSQQIPLFRAANRPDAVMALYHMIRDHVLVKDAAQNVLARRGHPSRPVIIHSDEPMPTTPEEMIRHDIAMHEKALADTQQLLANANTASERAIYQRALDTSQKHLTWMRNLDQGQRLSLGHFGPTVPLSMIASYRSEIGERSAARNRNGRRGR